MPPYLHNCVSVSMKLYLRWLAPLPFEVNLHFYVITAAWIEIMPYLGEFQCLGYGRYSNVKQNLHSWNQGIVRIEKWNIILSRICDLEADMQIRKKLFKFIQVILIESKPTDRIFVSLFSKLLDPFYIIGKLKCQKWFITFQRKI